VGGVGGWVTWGILWEHCAGLPTGNGKARVSPSLNDRYAPTLHDSARARASLMQSADHRCEAHVRRGRCMLSLLHGGRCMLSLLHGGRCMLSLLHGGRCTRCAMYRQAPSHGRALVCVLPSLLGRGTLL
jgi:hypothetical protein